MHNGVTNGNDDTLQTVGLKNEDPDTIEHTKIHGEASEWKDEETGEEDREEKQIVPTILELEIMREFCMQLQDFALMQPTECMLKQNPSCHVPPDHITRNPHFAILCKGADAWRGIRENHAKDGAKINCSAEKNNKKMKKPFRRMDISRAIQEDAFTLVEVFTAASDAYRLVAKNKALGQFRGNTYNTNFFEEGLFECMSIGACPDMVQFMQTIYQE